jgi:hypothetical protein
MPSLFAAASAIVPCPSASPLACRCCRYRHCRQRRRRTCPTDPCCPPPPPPLSFRRRASFCCHTVLRSGLQLLTPPLPSRLPSRRSPYGITVDNAAPAVAVAVPPPHELLLLHPSPFGIAVIAEATAATAVSQAMVLAGSTSQLKWRGSMLRS